MAQITWRNVETPDFSSAAESQRLSQVMLNQGLGAIGTALDKYKEAGIQRAVGGEAQELAGLTTAAQLDAALSSGVISAESMQDPTFRAQVFARKQALLENEQQRLSNVNLGLTGEGLRIDNQGRVIDNQGKVIQNAAATETLEQNKFLHENIRKEYAAAPAATSAVNTVLSLADGTPQGLKNSYAKLEELMPALQAAGMGAEFIEGLRKQIRETSTSEITQKSGFSEEEKRVLGIQQTKDADALFKQALAATGSLQASKNYILANSSDPVVIGLAMKQADAGVEAGLYPTGDMSAAAIEQSVNAAKSGINYGTVANQIIGVESSGDPNAQNPNSSAGGLGQFIDSTWLKTVKQYRPDIASGKSDEEILALKTDPGLNRQMTVAHTAENGAFLQSKGIEANPGNLYLAHHFGADGAAAVLRAPPGTSLESILGSDKIAANPHLKGMTVADARNWATQKMGGQKGAVTGPTSAADQASSQIRAAATAAAPGAGVTRELANEGVRLGSQAQILNNQLTLNQSLDATIPMLQEMTSGTPGHEADIARQMHASVGDQDGLTEAEITGQITRMKEIYGVPAHVAAAMLKNATEQTSWGAQWLQGKIQIDETALDNFARQFINPDAADQAGKIRPAMELMSQAQSRKYNADKLAQAQERVTAAEKEYASQVLAQQTRPGINTREAAERLILAQDEFRREITRVNGSPYAGGGVLGGTPAAGGAGGTGQTVATVPAAGTNGATPPAPDATATAAVPAPLPLTPAQQLDANIAEAKAATTVSRPDPRAAQRLADAEAAKVAAAARDAHARESSAKVFKDNPNAAQPGVKRADKAAAEEINKAATKKPAETTSPAKELEEAVITPEKTKTNTDSEMHAQDVQILDYVKKEVQQPFNRTKAKRLAKVLEDRNIPRDQWPAVLKKMISLPSDEDEE